MRKFQCYFGHQMSEWDPLDRLRIARYCKRDGCRHYEYDIRRPDPEVIAPGRAVFHRALSRRMDARKCGRKESDCCFWLTMTELEIYRRYRMMDEPPTRILGMPIEVRDA